MSNSKPIDFQELQALTAALFSPTALVGLAVLVACLGLSWLVVSVMHRRVAHRPDSVLFGSHVVDGALFPVLALLLALLAKQVLPHFGLSPAVFKLAVPVLMSLLAIRMTVRVLSAALPNSGLVKVIERTVSWLAWGGSILWVTGLLPWFLEELDAIDFKVGVTKISLRNLIEGSFTAVVVLVLALWVSSVIEARLLRGGRMDLSLRKIAANITRALLLLVGLLFALSAAGIDLTALGVLGGALGVGIGLGLQRLAANYVSGFVILAERSLRIGDMVKVDNFEGRISDIKTRYTVIRALNGREAIVPNEMLITQRVENSSLADPKVLLSTVVQVAYGTDVDDLMPKLAARVSEVPRVLSEPGPAVQLSSFAADGLELTVFFWIADPENGQGGVRSDVNVAILRLLNGMKIEIPFPQRVVRQA
ncbi:mechanosensitive ion channel family protein [Paucibacter sp. DJ2R-2]|uniref:mechanosensitive ion channel family protein n=1 Tax=Paucibacter sp. DJ2R-2 TaxID=2893558 RepID=UPI0021E487FB|nr:mechanosensitive ion channel domain-containing protein [Paucibacter sp. DJ2R-2]MCV2420801.1 mechanosensitive ion channel [Paucibacter sp. DJ4R-1]MCV2440000.1 mechanosensitive ion channel [Paucibacter sp. DJ2R-2]